MINICNYEDNFYEHYNKEKRKVIVYGAGLLARSYFPYYPEFDFYCDKRSDEIREMFGKKVLSLKELEQLKESLYVIVSINRNNEKVYREIIEELRSLDINADIFDFFHNSAFNCFQRKQLPPTYDLDRPMRVRIVCRDKSWILRKFAIRMNENLIKMGINSDIDDCPDPNADINHHIIFDCYEPVKGFNDTLMVTHIDHACVIDMLKYQLQTAKMAICMSKDTMNTLVSYGVPRDKLCYVNPGHDDVFQIKKYVLGMTYRCYDKQDYRKRATYILDICQVLDPRFFAFKIMGNGWDDIVKDLREMSFEVEYYSEFDYETYLSLIPSLDYYLYIGRDEGNMGVVDAISAGVKTIITSQGFHLDIPNGITHACETISDFQKTLLQLQRERQELSESVAGWTWELYTKKHLDIWKKILNTKDKDEVYKEQHEYLDGVFSMMPYEITLD